MAGRSFQVRLSIAALGFCLLGAGQGTAQERAPIPVTEAKSYTRTEDVIYGRKDGVALTMDVFKPLKSNGAAIIEIVSGGYFSSHSSVQVAVIDSFLKRGYTVFCVVHGSQPRYQ